MEQSTNSNPQRYSESFLDSVFFYDPLVDRAQILHGFAIIIDNKFYTHAGKFLFNTRKQALQTFYNGVRWMACNRLWQAEGHPSSQYPSDADRSRLWRQFKRNLERNHNFQVVQL